MHTLLAEDFVTPSSTPPQEMETETETPEEEKKEDSKLTELAADLTETALLDKIYDKYVTLEALSYVNNVHG